MRGIDMAKTASITQAEIERIIKAATRCGLTIYGCDYRRGRLRLICNPAEIPLDADHIGGDDSAQKPIPWPTADES